MLEESLKKITINKQEKTQQKSTVIQTPSLPKCQDVMVLLCLRLIPDEIGSAYPHNPFTHFPPSINYSLQTREKAGVGKVSYLQLSFCECSTKKNIMFYWKKNCFVLKKHYNGGNCRVTFTKCCITKVVIKLLNRIFSNVASDIWCSVSKTREKTCKNLIIHMSDTAYR